VENSEPDPDLPDLNFQNCHNWNSNVHDIEHFYLQQRFANSCFLFTCNSWKFSRLNFSQLKITHMESNSGPESNTAVGDIVCVVVDSGSAHGVNLVADASGFGAIVESWDRASGGKFGVVQKHGGVHLGNYLFAINDNQMSSVPFAEVLSVLNDRNILKKYLKFMSSSEYHRRKYVL
jgi:hypothetical protein